MVVIVTPLVSPASATVTNTCGRSPVPDAIPAFFHFPPAGLALLGRGPVPVHDLAHLLAGFQDNIEGLAQGDRHLHGHARGIVVDFLGGPGRDFRHARGLALARRSGCTSSGTLQVERSSTIGTTGGGGGSPWQPATRHTPSIRDQRDIAGLLKDRVRDPALKYGEEYTLPIRARSFVVSVTKHGVHCLHGGLFFLIRLGRYSRRVSRKKRTVDDVHL